MQQTLARAATISGHGLHTGTAVSLMLAPAPEGFGLVFCRTDVERGAALIPALHSSIVCTRMCSKLSNGEHEVGTVEHLMAALWAQGIDNALMYIDGPEVPIMDGSSLAFYEAVQEAGIQQQHQPRRYIRITQEVEVLADEGDGYIRFCPSSGTGTGAGGQELSMQYTIDFAHSAIGNQAYDLVPGHGPAAFQRDLAPARTFGFAADAERLRQAGLALGASEENVVIIEEDGIRNPEGLRYADECVRHKVLDCLGDLYLAGKPLLGHVVCHKGGHRLTALGLAKLLSAPQCYEVVTL